jgi:SAM-dependent methyltransferase
MGDDKLIQNFPRTLNVGSGYGFREDCLNADLDAKWNADWHVDLSQPLSLPLTLETRRYGTVQLVTGCFEKVIAHHVLEHIPDLVQTMTNLLNLLVEGGELHIEVPYDLSYGAWQDPTHVRAFNERSWMYFTEMPWYVGWTSASFRLISQEFVLSPLGLAYRDQGIAPQEILLRPRAVDAIRAVLRKAALRPS